MVQGKERESWLHVTFDKFFALTALLFFTPLFITVGLLLLLREGRPLFFGHERVGKNGRRFLCYKFRTMVPDARERLDELLQSDPAAKAEWEAHHKLDNDPRVTCLGTFMRKSSLDELPQFWNVLRGDMAIVGPRPIEQDEGDLYGDHFDEYKSVRPGITGLWQVSGRSSTSYEERIALDMEYISKRSFWGDLVIIAKTVKVVLTRRGAA